MKHLNQFQKFDWEAFAKDKRFIVVGISEWKDFDSKAVLGSKVDCVIIEDNTSYKQKDGEYATNLFEKLSFKVPTKVSIPMDSIVKPVGAVATIYGDHRNMLSIKCSDIQVLNKSTK
jgi:hypothetical protein